MQIKNCRSYHAELVDFEIMRFAESKSVFKIYFLSITGRDKPELFTWEKCTLSKVEFKELVNDIKPQGVGFITAFPHITKIYRFCPEMETILDLYEYNTSGLEARDNSRSDGSREFACYAEAVIASEEYQSWAKAKSVTDYLAYKTDITDFPVVSKSKLQEYWGS